MFKRIFRRTRVLTLALPIIVISLAGCRSTLEPVAPLPTATATATPPLASPPDVTATAPATPAPPPTTAPTTEPTASPTPAPPSPAPDFEPVIGLELVAEGFTAPLVLVPPGDGSGRLFVADQTGLIWVLAPGGERLAQPFLDLRDRMVALQTRYDERGLLGLAFHPDYAQNGRFFVYYSAPLRRDGPPGWNHTSHVAEFRVAPDDPTRALPDSERVILQIDQPQSNHNGGQIIFGPDAYLYIAVGDGGGAHDLGVGHPDIGNGQDLSNLLGAILRIDVDPTGVQPYGIPADNPFVGREGRDEIWAYGLRNPFRMAFDTGGARQLLAGDVGQNLWEEVNVVVPGGNYGWRIREGTHCFDPRNPTNPPASCPDVGLNGDPLIDPVIEYGNANVAGGIGISVIGGYVYRGAALPQFYGRYVFGDWSRAFARGDGILLVATPGEAPGTLWPFEEVRIATSATGRLDRYLLSFGQDANGELYVLTTDAPGPFGDTGRVFRIVPAAGVSGN